MILSSPVTVRVTVSNLALQLFPSSSFFKPDVSDATQRWLFDPLAGRRPDVHADIIAVGGSLTSYKDNELILYPE